jgi:hypothetical protein
MSKFDASRLHVGDSQCFVCEKPIAGDDWYAQVKHGDWTVRLCCPPCAKAFYAKKLPLLRQLAVLGALASPRWPLHHAPTLDPA